ncbi:DUF4214 domain-containing protein [Noviherbaspirillum aerium]|uniref:DUF4214 domain-containing protein n=1 Tax=Noviherbaspirillum aerium TaxID=2588497 RepID=UPI00124D3BFA|nr:DUF4214 domain-containing protein [Noviherbaspirillum aerium]
MKHMALATTALLCSLLVACGGGTSSDQAVSAASTNLRSHISISSPDSLQGTTGVVHRMYYAALGRAPDPQGLHYWAEALASKSASLADLTHGFYNSPEFQQRYGSLSNAQFIQLLYRNTLGREPDSEGFAFHVQNLDAGRADRPNTLYAFSESLEHTFRVASIVGGTSTGAPQAPSSPPPASTDIPLPPAPPPAR